MNPAARPSNPHTRDGGRCESLKSAAVETLRICKDGGYSLGGQWVTISFGGPAELVEWVGWSIPKWSETAICVTQESAIDAVARMAGSGRVTCLNFASARRPGGGFLNGQDAQEESLARSSSLYASIVERPEFYEGARESRGFYSDKMLWSRDVAFFRDSAGKLVKTPFYANVITCAAPNARVINASKQERALPDVLRYRIRCVLALAAAKKTDYLILGAWGCGVFGNDPVMVARIFAHELSAFRGAFKIVVFPILTSNPNSLTLQSFQKYIPASL